jgi:uncharacterized protein (TIGR03435 family)
LAERFKLVSHWEKRELPVYALIVSKEGHKLEEVKPEANDAKASAEKDNAGKESETNAAIRRPSNGGAEYSLGFEWHRDHG